jgi:hypothetical protein
MLIILLCCVFPSNVLPLLLDMQAPSFEWSAGSGNTGGVSANHLDNDGSPQLSGDIDRPAIADQGFSWRSTNSKAGEA